jgi:hypothetical protein
MTKEKPEQFYEVMEASFNWYKSLQIPNHFENIEFLGEYGDYYLYWAWNYKKESGMLFRNKIKNKVCEKCGKEIK